MTKYGALSASVLILLGYASCSRLLRSAVAESNPPVSPNRLVHDVIQNELKAQQEDRTYWRFRELTEADGHKELRDVFQTKDGEIYRIIALNDHSLTPEGNHVEDARIRKMLTHLEELRKDKQKREEDGNKERELLKSFPEAFQYQYEGADGDLIRLRFTPNPHFYPSKRQQQVFHHMEGTLWVDDREKRLAGIDGSLTSEVRFGGGILGHLDKGGTFSVKLQDVGSGHWDLVFLDVRLTGKALFFKTINFQQNEHCSNYQQISENTSLQQAVQLLQADAGERAATARN
jgi:hypothetical protein